MLSHRKNIVPQNILVTLNISFYFMKTLKYSLSYRAAHFSIYHVERPRLSRETLARPFLVPIDRLF